MTEPPPPESTEFLSGDLERDRRNLRLVMDTAEELYGVLDPEERTRRAVDRAVLVTGAEVGILLTSGDGGLLPRVGRHAEGYDLPFDVRYSRASVREVWETGQPLKVIGWDPGARVTDTMREEDLRSVMATRLAFQGRPLGVLYVHAAYETPQFTEHDFRVFLGLAGLIATAVENARLAEESAERRSLAQQVQLARQVQERLQPSAFENPAGFDVTAIGRVCENLSGDYYDVIHRPDRRIALVVGDVSSHGIRPALHMATARALLRRLMSENMAAAEALAAISTFLAYDMAENEFMSLFVGLLDVDERSLTWASAGQPALLQRSGGALEELERTGPILRVFPDVRYETSGPITLDSDDVLLLYTDGLSEAIGPDGRIWGEAPLRASFSRHAAAATDAHGVLQGILADVDDYRMPTRLSDDITCLAARAL